MKRILLALMMMVSVSFASLPQYRLVNGNYYELSNSSTPTLSKQCTYTYDTNPYTVGQIVTDLSFPSGSDEYFFVSYIYALDTYSVTRPDLCGHGNTLATVKYIKLSSSPCGANQVLENGICVNQPETCDTLAAKYPSPSGQCVDCMAFTNFSQRASCACDAIGSSWTPQNVMSVDYTTGGYTYQKTNTECDNGTWVAVYYNPVSNTPTDNNNSTPTDNNNTTPPQDTNNTTPTDGNNTTPPTTPSQADVVQALKDIQNGQKDATTALKDVGVDVKAMRDQMDKNSLTYADILKSINAGNEKADKMYQLTDDIYKGQTQIKNTMGKWVDDFSKSSTAQLGAMVDVKNAVDGTTNAVHGTTNAVNAQGDKIAGKLDDILNAIKDGNGTDMSATNDLLEKINKDTNSTASGVNKLHDDLNTTNEYISRMLDFFDSNSTVDTNRSGSSLTLADMLPEGGLGWFTNNSINANFALGSNACYCESFEFQIAGKTFLFPSPELLVKIPFDYISNMLMAFIYVLGLRSFLRS